MTAAYPTIASDLAALAADVAKPVFHVGDRVRARVIPSVDFHGEVVGVWSSFGGWVEIQPDLLDHTTIPCYYNQDPWVLEHITEPSS